MNIEFIATVSVIASDPIESRRLYVDALGLPLQAEEGSEYFHSEEIGGAKHFAVWPSRRRQKPASAHPIGPPGARFRKCRLSLRWATRTL